MVTTVLFQRSPQKLVFTFSTRDLKRFCQRLKMCCDKAFPRCTKSKLHFVGIISRGLVQYVFAIETTSCLYPLTEGSEADLKLNTTVQFPSMYCCIWKKHCYWSGEWSSKKCLTGKVICAFFCPAYRRSPVT
jgi:hypothetical protein